MAYWLFKSEPDTYSIHDLEKDGSCDWEGVRNFQARNFLRDDVKAGDGVLFYHSNIKVPAAVGTAEVVRAAYPDPTQFDPRSRYFDEKADPADPRWWLVDIAHRHTFATAVTLPVIKATHGLRNMVLLGRSRLSIQPVTAAEWKIISDL